MSSFKILEYRERAESLYGIEKKEITERDLEALLEGKRLWTDINWEYAITIRLKDRLKELELDKEIERLNNIINELDGYLDLKRKSYIEGFKWSGLEIIDQTKDFLQELKGSDKVE